MISRRRVTAQDLHFDRLAVSRHDGRLHRVVLPLLQDLARPSLNPIHLIGKGKPPLREQRKTFLQRRFDR
jgi:hypothetical protein